MSAGRGHNSVAAQELLEYIEKVESLRASQSELAREVTGVFSEAKGRGFDIKTMRRVLVLRGMSKEDRIAAQQLLEVYAEALALDLI